MSKKLKQGEVTGITQKEPAITPQPEPEFNAPEPEVKKEMKPASSILTHRDGGVKRIFFDEKGKEIGYEDPFKPAGDRENEE
jgi:hypothetical protein